MQDNLVFKELLNPYTRQTHPQIEYYTAEPEDILVDPTDDEISTTINKLKNKMKNWKIK